MEGLSEGEIIHILDTARSFREVIMRPIRIVPTLRGYAVANLFFEPSTRTKVSFELAEKRLSCELVSFSSLGSSVSKGESLLDTVLTIEAMQVDAVVIRHNAQGAPHFLAERIDASVINAGDGFHEHPTQALLDLHTIREKFDDFKGLKVAIIGDIAHSRVALSDIIALNTLGAEITLCGPKSLMPFGIESMGVAVTHDLMEALESCDVAYLLRIQMGRFPGMSAFEVFSKSVDGEDCPKALCYHADEFISMSQKAGFDKVEYLGGFFSDDELHLVTNYRDMAIDDKKLEEEHKDFLRNLEYNKEKFPVYKGKTAGFGGVYHLYKQ